MDEEVKLTQRDKVALVEALISPPEPNARLREAVLAERERCAKIAEDFSNNHGMRSDGAEGWAELIAKEIRKG